jgi:hypothetical protein
MKITDINQSQLPLKVKLNQNWRLDESIENNTIIQINSFKPDMDNCYEVFVTVLAKDLEYNKSVCISDWYNTTKTDVWDWDFYEANSDLLDINGNYNFSIYVMNDEDVFDIEFPDDTPVYSVNDMMKVVKALIPTLHVATKDTDTLRTFMKELLNN